MRIEDIIKEYFSKNRLKVYCPYCNNLSLIDIEGKLNFCLECDLRYKKPIKAEDLKQLLKAKYYSAKNLYNYHKKMAAQYLRIVKMVNEKVFKEIIAEEL